MAYLLGLYPIDNLFILLSNFTDIYKHFFVYTTCTHNVSLRSYIPSPYLKKKQRLIAGYTIYT